MEDAEAVFDDSNFAVPELLRGFDAAHLREILLAETQRWQGAVANTSIFLPYHCIRLLLDREGLSPANAECLRILVRHNGNEWKDRYLSALVREFKFIEDYIRTTSRQYADELASRGR